MSNLEEEIKKDVEDDPRAKQEVEEEAESEGKKIEEDLRKNL